MSITFAICYNFFMSKFRERLKELRIEKGLSQNKLAPQIGFQQATICDWESGKKEPTTAALIACALFFDVTTDYLLGREDDFGNVTLTSGDITGNNNTVNSHNTIHARTVAKLSDSDAELLRKYHAAPAKIQKAIKELLS